MPAISETSICRNTLATQVDTFVFHTTFVPLKISAPVKVKPPLRPPAQFVPYKPSSVISSKLVTTIKEHVSKEIESNIKIPSIKAIERLVKVQGTTNKWGINKLVSQTKAYINSEIHQIRTKMYEDAAKKFINGQKDDGKSVIKAPSLLSALQRLGANFLIKNKLFQSGYLEKKLNNKKIKIATIDCNNLGFLFLERLRIRPIGHTLERAPFYELSLEPGDIVSLRQKSFSKRATSLESTVEESEEKKIEYSSTFTTELSEESGNTLTDSSNWGVNAAVSGTYGNPNEGSVSGQVGSQYGASSANTESYSEITRKIEQVVRKVETQQKILHKTVVSFAREDTLEEEAVKVIRNDDSRLKKIMMRRMMQVLHLSEERYGVRFCWSPPVEDPGRDARKYVPGPDGFPDEIAAIKAECSTLPPPAELGTMPPSQQVSTGWTGVLSGGTGGYSSDLPLGIIVPDGYVYSDAIIEKKDIDGDPNVYFRSKPAIGSTGAISFSVHVGLDPVDSFLFDAENVNIRVKANCLPGQTLISSWNATVDQWRKQIEKKKIDEFLESKTNELSQMNLQAWPASELMRRIIAENFSGINNVVTEDLIAQLHEAFEWENLSYVLRAPWWKPQMAINGLQSLRTTFLNASWAKVYVPIRPGHEEEALSWLLSIGAIPDVDSILSTIELYLRGMKNDLEPLFAREYSPGNDESEEIDSPQDLLLTKLGSDKWDNKFEKGGKFVVMGRWTSTIPTDGVDYEESFEKCNASTPKRDATESIEQSKADVFSSISKRIDSGDGQIAITVSEGQ